MTKKLLITWLALCAALFGAWQLQTMGVPQFKSAHIERLLVTPAEAACSINWMTGFGTPINCSGGSSVTLDTFGTAFGGSGAGAISAIGNATNTDVFSPTRRDQELQASFSPSKNSGEYWRRSNHRSDLRQHRMQRLWLA